MRVQVSQLALAARTLVFVHIRLYSFVFIVFLARVFPRRFTPQLWCTHRRWARCAAAGASASTASHPLACGAGARPCASLAQRISFSLGLRNRSVAVPADRLLLGLANGWAGEGGKALFLPPAEVGRAWAALPVRPRGLMFWDIADEGRAPAGGGTPLFFAGGLNRFLHTRPAAARFPGETRGVHV